MILYVLLEKLPLELRYKTKKLFLEDYCKPFVCSLHYTLPANF